MKDILLVGFGGFVGSIARYRLGAFILHRSESWPFPLSTLCINLLGCFVIGALAGLAEKYSFLTNDLRLLLFTGFLGGFTTFSAFGLEGMNLIRRGDWAIAFSYAACSVIGGLLAVWIGLKLFGFNAGRA